jgi:hypothetical protein
MFLICNTMIKYGTLFDYETGNFPDQNPPVILLILDPDNNNSSMP